MRPYTINCILYIKRLQKVLKKSKFFHFSFCIQKLQPFYDCSRCFKIELCLQIVFRHYPLKFFFCNIFIFFIRRNQIVDFSKRICSHAFCNFNCHRNPDILNVLYKLYIYIKSWKNQRQESSFTSVNYSLLYHSITYYPE